MSIAEAFVKQWMQQQGMGDCARSSSSEKDFGISGGKQLKKSPV